jgi:hypothetical protein
LPEEVVEHEIAPLIVQGDSGALYCVCKQPETEDMIGCDECDNWFHPQCLEKLGVKVSEIQNIADFPFSCRDCIKRKKHEELRQAKQTKAGI